MDESRDNEPSTVVNIAADGDVILVVGPEKVKLRVLSLFLKAASEPFHAMFGPDWKEGHDMLDRDTPVELLLPEDNALALKVICAVLHHRNNEVPQTLGSLLPFLRTSDIIQDLAYINCRYHPTRQASNVRTPQTHVIITVSEIGLNEVQVLPEDLLGKFSSVDDTKENIVKS
ncbi:uncharacterized protein RAG0_12649 [Rhynchosporium agropyri]|uniref:BTB domain-containing protein n=1 Tax=Rhynchosporium agropyri TaxID=914238 RepID=A0A1E1L910_9HELO|nr:uncharacterized protein RAG0_12649 [Rhynchosporium agropyri]